MYLPLTTYMLAAAVVALLTAATLPVIPTYAVRTSTGSPPTCDLNRLAGVNPTHQTGCPVCAHTHTHTHAHTTRQSTHSTPTALRWIAGGLIRRQSAQQ
ncbi:hypothetical protein J3F83DRAFT_756041 [Trichoderma novae-zelandiae]